MFVQGEQDIGKAVHEAAGGLAPNGLRKRGSQYIFFSAVARSLRHTAGSLGYVRSQAL